MSVDSPDLASKAAVKLRDELIARLAHDARTPLGAILTWLELLKSQVDDPHARRSVEAAQQSARDLVEIVSAVEDAQRLAAGTLELQLSPVDLAALVAFAADRARSSGEGRGIVQDRDLGLAGISVLGDLARLRHAFGRVLFHCTSLSGKGTMRLVLRAEAPQARVVITCPALALSVPLQQALNGHDEWPSIVGPNGQAALDFAVSCRVLRLHGGRLEAAALPDDAGTELVATLPLAK